jgi:hypothetical protein
MSVTDAQELIISVRQSTDTPLASASIASFATVSSNLCGSGIQAILRSFILLDPRVTAEEQFESKNRSASLEVPPLNWSAETIHGRERIS